MQTLGLASEIKPTDGMFKRLLWPDITNQYDVDLVGQQGFWVCTVVAVLTTVILNATGSPVIGDLVGITYFLGALGVRERSIAAAVIVFLCYFLDRVASVEGMIHGVPLGGNPLLGIVATMLLFANVRATILSRKWTAPETEAEVSEMPERATVTPLDKFSNALPAAAWPVARFVFYPLGGLLLILTILGTIALARTKPPTPFSQTLTAPPPPPPEQTVTLH